MAGRVSVVKTVDRFMQRGDSHYMPRWNVLWQDGIHLLPQARTFDHFRDADRFAARFDGAEIRPFTLRA